MNHCRVLREVGIWVWMTAQQKVWNFHFWLFSRQLLAVVAPVKDSSDDVALLYFTDCLSVKVEIKALPSAWDSVSQCPSGLFAPAVPAGGRSAHLRLLLVSQPLQWHKSPPPGAPPPAGSSQDSGSQQKCFLSLQPSTKVGFYLNFVGRNTSIYVFFEVRDLRLQL